MTALVFGGVSLYNTNTHGRTLGLWIPHTSTADYFEPAPVETRRVVCIDKAQTTVLRAFQERQWKIIPLNKNSKDPASHYLHCYQAGNAAIIWTKMIPHHWNTSFPWQRHNQLPFETDMSKKARTVELLRTYAIQQGRTLSYIPESYVLPQDRDVLLKRLTVGHPDMDPAQQQLRGGGVVMTDSNEPWVVKLSAIDNGVGITMMGAGSQELKLLTSILRHAKQQQQPPVEYMTAIRRQLVLSRRGADDTRKQSDLDKALNRTEKLHDKIIVQRYVCHEMDYQGRKFDLRVYFLVASVDPVVVYAHDGYLRVSPHEYNERNFDKTGDHLTNLGRNAQSENNTISYEQWEVELRRLVNESPERFSWSVRRNPLQHIKNQIKSALADLVAATRQYAFRGYRHYTTMQNGFALFGGDFIVDRDLNVWFTEGQDSPGLLHETSMKRKLNDRLLPATVEIIEQVLDKQCAGQPLFPMHKTGDFELIYTDDFQYRYEFERKPLLGPCAASIAGGGD